MTNRRYYSKFFFIVAFILSIVFLAAITVFIFMSKSNEENTESQPVGGPYSIAVGPGSGFSDDIAEATVTDITLDEALSNPILGEYIPTDIPEEYDFRSGLLYKTIMEDGTEYYRLYVEFSADNGKLFRVYPMNYRSDTSLSYVDIEDLSFFFLDSLRSSGFHVYYDDIEVGFEFLGPTTEEIYNMVSSLS